MQTSCPECGTTFRVSQEHLGLRRGLVRCGHCNAVFNAYDTLLPELEKAPPGTGIEGASSFPEEGVETVDAGFQRPVDSAPQNSAQTDIWAEVQAELDAPRDLPIVPPRDALATYLETATVQLPSETEETITLAETVTPPTPEATPETESPDAILLSELPNRQADRPGLPKWKALVYVLLILCLTVALVGQLAYFLRGELAAALPESRPLLNVLCQPLDCVVPLPQQLTRQAIVSSSLEHNAEQKSRVRLYFLLANRTGQTQAWPHVILTLSDMRESPVAQKAFPPEDYLPRGVSPRAGFPAQSEQEARMELDIGNLAAASYVISIAYP
jgi:predicted Zn finger-like uncharacterized protein